MWMLAMRQSPRTRQEKKEKSGKERRQKLHDASLHCTAYCAGAATVNTVAPNLLLLTSTANRLAWLASSVEREA